jgi:uncharacterized OsmC-like protein
LPIIHQIILLHCSTIQSRTSPPQVLGKSQLSLWNILKNLKINVRGKRADSFPKVYKEIEVNYIIQGNKIDPKAVEDAIRLSEEKYCSVSAMLREVADIRWTYNLIPWEEE